MHIRTGLARKAFWPACRMVERIMDFLKKITESQLTERPSFRPGDTVKVNVKVVEGNRHRIQVFQASLSPARVATVSTVPSQFVRHRSALEWSVRSHCTLQMLTRSRSLPAVTSVVQSYTTCVTYVVRLQRLRKSATKLADHNRRNALVRPGHFVL